MAKRVSRHHPTVIEAEIAKMEQIEEIHAEAEIIRGGPNPQSITAADRKHQSMGGVTLDPWPYDNLQNPSQTLYHPHPTSKLQYRLLNTQSDS